MALFVEERTEEGERRESVGGVVLAVVVVVGGGVGGGVVVGGGGGGGCGPSTYETNSYIVMGSLCPTLSSCSTGRTSKKPLPRKQPSEWLRTSTDSS